MGLRRILKKAKRVAGYVTGIGPASKLVQRGTSGGVLLKAKQGIRKVDAIDQGIKTAGFAKFRIKNPRSVALFQQAGQVSQGVALAAVTGGGATAVAGSVASSVVPLIAGGSGPTEETAWNPDSDSGGIESAADFAPDPAIYGPSAGWPARPETAVVPPSGPSPVLALSGIGVGLYLLTKGG